MPAEYRVRWRREDRRASTRIVQSWDTACKIVWRVNDLERHRHDPEAVMADGRRYSDFEHMPPLVERPVIEVREVGEWSANEHQPLVVETDPPYRAPREANDSQWDVAF